MQTKQKHYFKSFTIAVLQANRPTSFYRLKHVCFFHDLVNPDFIMRMGTAFVDADVQSSG